MTRFYVPEPQIEKGMMRVEGGEVRHIRSVLRLKVGDALTIFDGLGAEYEGTIMELRPTAARIMIRSSSSPQRDSPLEITLAQSLLKGEKMDTLVQKATELGVTGIIPFLSSRSIPLLEKRQEMKRHLRWEKISVEASKQCGRGVLPRVWPIQDYPGVLELAPEDSLKLMLWEREGMALKEILRRPREKNIFFVVGPEGGLSEEEVEEAKGKGFIPILLGKRILRSETTSLSLLSILQYEWGDIG
jgi:16S rRNA (uracil1498-N3)-methyltransferase